MRTRSFRFEVAWIPASPNELADSRPEHHPDAQEAPREGEASFCSDVPLS